MRMPPVGIGAHSRGNAPVGIGAHSRGNAPVGLGAHYSAGRSFLPRAHRPSILLGQVLLPCQTRLVRFKPDRHDTVYAQTKK